MKDAELELWREQWVADTVVPPDLRRRVERQTWWMKVNLLGEVLVTVVIGGGVTALAVRSPEPAMILLAAVTWMFFAIAWAVALKVNRGNWSPSADDTASFIDLSIRRCRSRLVALRFAVALFVAEMAFCLSWIYRNGGPAEAHSPLRWAPAAILTAIFSGFYFWYRRKKRGELAYLLSLSADR